MEIDGGVSLISERLKCENRPVCVFRAVMVMLFWFDMLIRVMIWVSSELGNLVSLNSSPWSRVIWLSREMFVLE